MFNRPVSTSFLIAAAMMAFANDVAYAESPTYQPEWSSLRQHQPAPDWFRDAKFGVYFHWGVYSVPAFGNEWYPRNMHNKADASAGSVYRHHRDTYGEPSEYGYERFVPEFTAEHFDAREWCELFQQAGARFVGPVAEHHDG
ncbi:MAG: alpha-L-fucosidase, partial [Planctomycetales bacterium]|nr:alpha-L-fucosidase [Planctomycetales bacterium]